MTAPSLLGKWGTFVISREKCPTCGGTGMMREDIPHSWSVAVCDCPNCDGNGYIETEIPLLGALRELGVAFKKDATTAADRDQQGDEDDDDGCADDEPPINARRYLP